MDWKTFCLYAGEFRFPDEYVSQLEPWFSKLDMEFYISQLNAGEIDREEIMKRYPGEDYRFFNMLLAIGSWPQLVECYRQRGYAALQLEDIRKDLKLWADKNVADMGFPGLNWRIWGWFNEVRRGSILQFGRLQCNLRSKFLGKIAVFAGDDGALQVKETENNLPGALLSPGDDVINIHIPACGPLKKEACIDSIKRMMEFNRVFQKDFDYKAVVCYSWILDPVFTKIMDSTNLADFQNLGHLFPIPGRDETREVIWRVFNVPHDIDVDPAELPRDTGMRRAAADYIGNGGKFTEYGFFILRSELEKW